MSTDAGVRSSARDRYWNLSPSTTKSVSKQDNGSVMSALRKILLFSRWRRGRDDP